MGRRNSLRQFHAWNSVDSTLSPVSIGTEVTGLDRVTYVLTVDSTVLGALKVQFCNDDVLSPLSIFRDLDFAQALTLDGSLEMDYTVKIENHGFKYLRLAFVNGAGLGNISAWISGNTAGA